MLCIIPMLALANVLDNKVLEQFWWEQEAEGVGKRIMQCLRPFRIFILGLRATKGIWGCWEGARRTRDGWYGPENDFHLFLIVLFLSLHFLHLLRSSEPYARSSRSTHQRVPLQSFCSVPALVLTSWAHSPVRDAGGCRLLPVISRQRQD